MYMCAEMHIYVNVLTIQSLHILNIFVVLVQRTVPFIVKCAKVVKIRNTGKDRVIS